MAIDSNVDLNSMGEIYNKTSKYPFDSEDEGFHF